jgi:hypothetical protein
MMDFYPAITGRYSGRRVHVALVVGQRQERVPGSRPNPEIMTMPISLASSSPWRVQ